MNRVFKFAILLIIFSVITACGNNTVENRLDWKVDNFEYTNQDSKTVSLGDLEGKVWVADFIFTACTEECPMQTNNMESLQRKIAKEGIENVHFISFTVDPKADTPEVLTEFATKYSADLKNWDFLTGYTQEEIKVFAKESFKTVADKLGDTDFIHATYFYLVDKNGTIAKYYPGQENVPFDEIISDIKVLVKE
jgi:protein SCO1